MLQRTLKYVLQEQKFKILGAGRTDAMVSANEAAFELFLTNYELDDLDIFLNDFNLNLPQDIRALSINKVDKDFNIINDSKVKEYIYLFTYGQKCHPFCAPILTTILEDLDIEIMKKGAVLFKGHHNFKAYCYQAKDNGVFDREIISAEIFDNTEITASFFPDQTYIFKVKGKGFGRNQIRLMMGALIKLGRGEVSLDYIDSSLKDDSEELMDYIAPASGLILNRIEFE